MPLNAFPGTRNWGYDGVFPSAVQHSYGGPEALARFVDAAHPSGMAVVLDVVYNHVGPEGSVFGRFAPYFTDAYRTPWGDAVNVAEAESDNVRRTFIESATRWIEDFHVDGLRLDAIDMIHDPTASTFLEELTAAVHASGEAAGRTVLGDRRDASNDPRIVRPPPSAASAATPPGTTTCTTAARRARSAIGTATTSTTTASTTSSRRSSTAGSSAAGTPATEVGATAGPPTTSRSSGSWSSRPTTTTWATRPPAARPPFDPAQRILAAATILLSPFTPMLFMGEEYGEPAPFPYFVDHGDPDLLEAVRVGRRNEFARSEWTEAVADPADPARRTSVPCSTRRRPVGIPHREMLDAYTELIALRRRHPVAARGRRRADRDVHGDTMVVEPARTAALGPGARRQPPAPTTVPADVTPA